MDSLAQISVTTVNSLLTFFFFLSVNWNIALVVLYVYNPDDEVIHSPRALIVQCCFCLE